MVFLGETGSYFLCLLCLSDTHLLPSHCPTISLPSPAVSYSFSPSSSAATTIFRDGNLAALQGAMPAVSVHGHTRAPGREGRRLSLKMVVAVAAAGPGREVTVAARRRWSSIHFAEEKQSAKWKTTLALGFNFGKTNCMNQTTNQPCLCVSWSIVWFVTISIWFVTME